MNKNVCVIPARQGSTRLKNKNFGLFKNKKLIEHTIISAIKSKLFDKIILSSDSNKILDLSKKYSVIPFFRDKFADNLSSVASATIYTLKKMELNKQYKNVVQLMPTCPLRDEMDIKKSFKNFERKKFMSQISCFKISWLHFNWAIEKKKNTYNHFFKKENRKKELNIFYPTGAIWIANINHLIKHGNFYNKNTKFFELDWLNSIDIDTKLDFKEALRLSKIK